MISPEKSLNTLNTGIIENREIKIYNKKSESLQTEGRHFRSMICKLSDV